MDEDMSPFCRKVMPGCDAGVAQCEGEEEVMRVMNRIRRKAQGSRSEEEVAQFVICV